MVRVLEERRVDLHLASENRLESFFHVIPCRNVLWSWCEFAALRYHAKLLLTSEGFLTNAVPAFIEFAFVLCNPVLWDVMRGVSCARSKVNEERLVGRDRLLLPDIGDRLVGEVLHQVVAFVRCPLGPNRCGAVVQRGVPLVGLSTNKAQQMF